MAPVTPRSDRQTGHAARGRACDRDRVLGKGAALAGSMLLNLMLLAGVVAAMRAPDLPPTGARIALVTVALTPEPKAPAAPPPPTRPELVRPKASPDERPLAPLPRAEPGPGAPLLAAPAAPPQVPAAPLAAPALAKATPPPAPVPPPTARPAPADLLAGYRTAVWQRILAARPRGNGSAGTVTVSFRLDASGALLSSDVTGSSGQVLLDRMALQAVRRAAPFPAPPTEAGTGPFAFSVPVEFH